MDTRLLRQSPTTADNAELAALGLADPWVCVCVNARVDSPESAAGRAPEFAQASFLLPSSAVARLASEIDERVAALPAIVQRGGGSLSLIFEEPQGLRHLVESLDLAGVSDAPARFSNFGERKIWLLPKVDPDPFGGSGLCVSYSATLWGPQAEPALRRAFAIEATEALGAALAAALSTRLGLESAPEVSIVLGPSVDSRNWHEGVPDLASSAWRSLSERIALEADHATIPARASRPASL